MCCCRHSGRAHLHDLIQVVLGPLMVSFARKKYFLGWNRNWYRLGRKSGWVRTAGFLLQLFCSVQARQGDIQVLCWRCHSSRARLHDLIQVISGPLMVSFARQKYFLGWHRNWYRLGRKSGWVRSSFSCESHLDITQPDLDIRINGDLR